MAGIEPARPAKAVTLVLSEAGLPVPITCAQYKNWCGQRDSNPQSARAPAIRFELMRSTSSLHVRRGGSFEIGGWGRDSNPRAGCDTDTSAFKAAPLIHSRHPTNDCCAARQAGSLCTADVRSRASRRSSSTGAGGAICGGGDRIRTCGPLFRNLPLSRRALWTTQPLLQE